ncbi:MAG: NAD(P)H-dependent oxidoreductase subunit E [Akkermansia sp.]|nr:NAD(P)H-dependent oxidoreductase subunit E [Akkermansia sp.]
MSETPDAIDALTVAKPSPGEKYFPKFEVTPELKKEAKKVIAQYPDGKEQSAILPLIHVVQEEFGFISPAAIEWIAAECNSTPIHVAGVVTFYPGIHTRCPGKYHFRVCHTIACAMSGGEELIAHICKQMGLDVADMDEEDPMMVSEDGLFSIEPVECLANCGFGPNVMVNDTLYSEMTPEKVDALMAELKTK